MSPGRSGAPFSRATRGDAHNQDNLTLRYRAHNDLAAEEDFGSDFIALTRDSTEHEPWSAQS